MPTANENQNTTNLNVVTGSKLEEFGSQIWDAMKTYITSHEDTSNLMTQVKSILDSANRQIIGTTGTQKANAINTAVQSMVAAFEAAGVDMTNVKTSEFAEWIGRLTAVTGVYILDANDTLWTAESWAFAKSQGQTMPNVVGVDIVLADQEIIVSKDEQTKAWGTYGTTLVSLDAYTGGPAGTPKDGKNNTFQILAQCDPDKLLPIGKTITYVAGTTTIQQITDAYCVLFADANAQVAFAQSMGLQQMNAWGQKKIYAYGTTGHWRTSYWKANQTTIAANSFQQIYASAPAADQYGFVGSPSAEWCLGYKAYTGDTKVWYEGSIFELFVLYLNQTAINACMTAIDGTLLRISTSIYYWSSLQYNSNGSAWCIELASGGIYYNGKGNQCAVRAFTQR